MKKAIIYCRVSTTDQAEHGYSLKTQEEICLEFAKRNKYEVLKVFIEKGESAKTLNRTALKEMLEYARINKNKIDAQSSIRWIGLAEIVWTVCQLDIN